jgi:hypothetical protein
MMPRKDVSRAPLIYEQADFRVYAPEFVRDATGKAVLLQLCEGVTTNLFQI